MPSFDFPDFSDLEDAFFEERLVVPFGKHRGTDVRELAETAPDYLSWMLSNAEHPWVADNADAIREAIADVKSGKAAEASRALTLTPHQQSAVSEVLSHFDDDNRVAALYGGAGYGKSYVTAGLVTELAKLGYTTRAMAVSYVASQVLAAQLDPFGVETGTVARTVKLEKVWNDDREDYVFTGDSQEQLNELLSERQALIVDEASMIDDAMADRLISTAERRGGRLILVGDDHQLPPVKQATISRCCNIDRAATLTEPMRYSRDSHLFGYEQAVRNNPNSVWGWSAADVKESPEVRAVSSVEDLIDDFVLRFKADPGALHRMMLFTRAGVVQANNSIREKLFGAKQAAESVVIEDEQLMILATTDYPSGLSREMGGVRYYSGQSFHAADVERAVHKIYIDGETYEIPHYQATLKEGEMPVRLIFGATESSLDQSKLGAAEFGKALAAARAYGKEHGDWGYWRRLQNDYVRVAYTYASTVHRSQGQTCDYAYCAPKSLLATRGIMGQALTYVAMTRAKKHLTIVL